MSKAAEAGEANEAFDHHGDTDDQGPKDPPQYTELAEATAQQQQQDGINTDPVDNNDSDDDDGVPRGNEYMQRFAYYRDLPFVWLSQNPRFLTFTVVAVLAALYVAYFIGVIVYVVDNNLPWEWCDGTGFLIIITSIVAVGLLYFQVLKPLLGEVKSVG